MDKRAWKRRDALKTLLAAIPAAALDWNSLPRGGRARLDDNAYDAVVIGSGLGGLSCAAAFARQGFKPLVLEHHRKAGGYASTFKRPGGFEFDVSLHQTTVGERDGIHNLIPGFPEIKDITFVPHPHLYHAYYPDFDINVPAKNIAAYKALLKDTFPEETGGIDGIFEDMEGLLHDLNKYLAAGGRVDMSRFPMDFPYLFKSYNKTWGSLLEARIKGQRLKAVLSALWGYYGLPPSKISSLYYAMPTIGFLGEGGYYPLGKSQKISDALVGFIEERGGRVKLGALVDKILVKDGAASGVRTADGAEYQGRVVVSNAGAPSTFRSMLEAGSVPPEYLARMDGYSPSLSTFMIFLGLKEDLVKTSGIKDTEIFYNSGYDVEDDYRACLEARVESGGYGLTLYDNLYHGYSPPGKNTMQVILLQGYEPWKKFEEDYFRGEKTAYRAEKNRLADILIDRVEKTLLPGLRRAIEVKEVATPLTNVRYTRNFQGAIYGWDQTLNNSGPNRFPHATPVKNLYLAGAWTSPGGGYSAVISSGLECFGEIMKSW